MNDIADRLAVDACEAQEEAAGDVVPDDLGDADVIGSPASPESPASPASTGGSRDRRLPDGSLVGVFGARPPELGGYDPNPIAETVGRRLQEILAAKHRVCPGLHVVSGLRLGAEMIGAEAAVAEGLPLVVVLPFPDPDSPWPASSRRRFARLCEMAATVVTLEKKLPDSKEKVGGSLRRRDAWLARNLDEAIVVWDGEEAFTGRLAKTLRDHLGDEVWDEPVPT
jgi:uncharacterized phage-like protein YoqJ